MMVAEIVMNGLAVIIITFGFAATIASMPLTRLCIAPSGKPTTLHVFTSASRSRSTTCGTKAPLTHTLAN